MSKETIVLCGCNGYIGNALTQALLSEGYKVIGVDNLSKVDMIKEMNSIPAVPTLTHFEKSKKFKKMGNYTFERLDISEDYSLLHIIIQKHKPSTIVNVAHMPSGPYSMMDRKHADFTLRNNLLGTNNILWAIKNNNPDIHYVTVGTTGEYDHYSNIDIEEGYFQFEHNGRQSTEQIFPRRPGSIYHASKTASTYLIDFCARSWGLRCTEPQQSVVFGLYTDAIAESEIYSDFNSDECFGTVVNRFIIQALLGEPLTIYGDGKHKRGFLSLNDSVQAMMLAVKNRSTKGRPQVWNQLSEWHSMNDIADMVVRAAAKTGMNNVRRTNIPTPRKEHTGDHYYNYVNKNLTDLGYEPTRTIEQEVEYVINTIPKWSPEQEEILKGVIMPKVKWN